MGLVFPFSLSTLQCGWVGNRLSSCHLSGESLCQNRGAALSAHRHRPSAASSFSHLRGFEPDSPRPGTSAPRREWKHLVTRQSAAGSLECITPLGSCSTSSQPSLLSVLEMPASPRDPAALPQSMICYCNPLQPSLLQIFFLNVVSGVCSRCLSLCPLYLSLLIGRQRKGRIHIVNVLWSFRE